MVRRLPPKFVVTKLRRGRQTRIQKARGRLRRTMTVHMGPSAFPQSLKVRLRYADSKTYTSTVTAVKQVYRGNGPFDPDLTGTGHQPLGLDEYFKAYSAMRCMGSSIKIWISNETAGTHAMVALQATSSEDVSPATIFPYFEYGRAKVLQVAGDNEAQGIMRMSQSTAAMLGRTDAEVKANADFSSSTGGLPSQAWLWRIASQNVDLSTSTVLRITVQLLYTIVFFQKKLLAES